MTYFKKALTALSIVILASCDSSSPTSVGSLRIDPANAVVEPGQSAQMVVIGGNGETITEGVTWSSSNRVLASVTSTGEVTGGYGSGSATITASVRSASATALVDLVRLCAELAPINGSPDPGSDVQSFDVHFVAGTDGVKRANELAALYGFSPTQVRSDGFSSELTPQQAAGVGCSRDVASMTYQ